MTFSIEELTALRNALHFTLYERPVGAVPYKEKELTARLFRKINEVLVENAPDEKPIRK
jgi:hypothetical protein